MSASPDAHDASDASHGAQGARTKTVAFCVIALLGLAGVLAASLLGHAADDHGAHAHASEHAPTLWLLGTLPFLAVLGAIAVFPLVPALTHWWHSNLSRLFVSVLASLGTLAYLWVAMGWAEVGTALHHAVLDEYVPFIVLLFALYVISGGIHLGGDLAATPLTNTTILAVGALIASFIGTTGASMLLIRPLLKTNRTREHTVHTVVMFIFLVSNIGGSLLPIGDDVEPVGQGREIRGEHVVP